MRVLLALDIDGTLVKSGHIPSSSVVARVRGLQARGVTIVLATGRQLHSVEPVVAALALDEVWVVASDGAVLARYVGVQQRMLRTYHFDPRALAGDLLRHDPEVTIGIEDVGVGYMVNRPFEKLISRDDKQTVVDVLPSEATMLTAGSTTLSGDQLARVVSEHGLSCTGWDELGVGWIDVAAEGLSKASGVATLVEEQLVECDFSVAVGDFLNDIAMLVWADLGVAMGHAPQDVLDSADFVTGTVEQDGLDQVLRELARVLDE